MDSYAKQLEYYQYVENQRNNYVDLSSDDNSSVYKLAQILFSKKEKNLKEDLSGILIDDTMDVCDVFCCLVELVLYGLDIITEKKDSIFDLVESYDDKCFVIKSYLKSAGFDMNVEEIFSMELYGTDTVLYRDSSDYYCEILKKPPPYMCHPGWYLLNYRLVDNKNFHFNTRTPIEKFKAFFISNNNKIFTINFNLKITQLG